MFISKEVNFLDNLGFVFCIRSIESQYYQWDFSLKILLVLNGKIDIEIEKNRYTMKEGEIVIFNLIEQYTLYGHEDNNVLIFRISYEFLKKYCKEADCITFDYKSFLHKNNKDRLIELKLKIAEIIIKSYDDMNFNYIEMYLIEIVQDLLGYCAVNYTKNKLRNEFKLEKSLKYIHMNYINDISLQQLADVENLSIYYLSKIFRELTGVTILDYVNKLRISKAYDQLLNTDKKVSDIAMNCGFPNMKSFNRVFKFNYQDTPLAYRKKYKRFTCNRSLNTDKKIIMRKLIKYYIPRMEKLSIDKNINTNDYGIIDVSKIGKSIYHKWRRMINITKAKNALMFTARKQLKKIQEEIGFEYIFFRGIFDDDMLLYDEDEEQKMILNFNLVDEVLDFFSEIGFKMMIEIGTIPTKLSAGDGITEFGSNLSSIKDMQKWNALVKEFLLHVIERYGLEEVETWKILLWTDPWVREYFWENKFHEYCRNYQNTYQIIKSVCQKCKIGGINCVIEKLRVSKWEKEFLKYAKYNQCVPDFLSLYSYRAYNTNNDQIELENKNIYKDNRDSINYLKEDILDAIEIFKNYGYEDIPIGIVNWRNENISILNDTCNRAANIVKNIVETMDLTEFIGYSSALDDRELIEKMVKHHSNFYGGYGLITNNSIKKASFYAFKLLRKLGNYVLFSNEGCYITKKEDNSIQVLLYNHFQNGAIASRIYEKGKNRMYKREIKIRLIGLQKKDYKCIENIVNCIRGSAYDQWIIAGKLDKIDSEFVDYLNQVSQPQKIFSDYYKVDSIEVSRTLLLDEIRMIEFIPNRK